MHVVDQHTNMAEFIESDQLSKAKEVHIVSSNLESQGKQKCPCSMAEVVSLSKMSLDDEYRVVDSGKLPWTRDDSNDSLAPTTTASLGTIKKRNRAERLDQSQCTSSTDSSGSSTYLDEGDCRLASKSDNIDDLPDNPKEFNFCQVEIMDTNNTKYVPTTSNSEGRIATPLPVRIFSLESPNKGTSKESKSTPSHSESGRHTRDHPTQKEGHEYFSFKSAMLSYGPPWDEVSLSSSDSEDVGWRREVEDDLMVGDRILSGEGYDEIMGSVYSFPSSGAVAQFDQAYDMLLSLMMDDGTLGNLGPDSADHVEVPGASNEDVRRTRGTQPTAPLYPHHPTRYMECEICLSKSNFWSRFCCHFKVCNECVDTYITLKVQEAVVHIECPNDKCRGYIHRNEIRDRLSDELKHKFDKFLVDANKDPCKKTCPACSSVHTIDPDALTTKKKRKNGLKVQCSECHLQWCFLCQAPFHTGVTCKQYRKGDEMVRKWAKEVKHGKFNAQRCPKCKTFIQKTDGCDHMKCTQCSTDFCYRCGDRYIRIKFIGNHFSRFSLFGCKYRLMPKKPVLRRLIRGTNFAARMVAGVVLAGLGLAAGIGLLGASVFILPGYGIFRLHRHRKIAKKRKHVERRMHYMILEMERERALKEGDVALNSQGNTSTGNEESEVENPDPQQVQVIVHRAVSVTEEAGEEPSGDCELYANRFTAEGTEVMVEPSAGEGGEEEGEENFLYVADIKEVSNKGGYSTVVANIVSKVGQVVEDACARSKMADVEKTKVPGGDAQVVGKGEERDGKGEERDGKDGKSGKLEEEEEKVESSSGQTESTGLSSQTDTQVGVEMSQGMTDCDKVSHCDKVSRRDSSVPSEETQPSANSKNLDVTIIVQDDVNKGNTDDSKSSKLDSRGSSMEALHGCFGNIFSKRSQNMLTAEGDAAPKSFEPGLQTKFLHRKSATWEKIRNSKVESVLNFPHFEKVVDGKAVLVHRSPSAVSAMTTSKDFSSLALSEKDCGSTDHSLDSIKGCRGDAGLDCPKENSGIVGAETNPSVGCGEEERDTSGKTTVQEADHAGYLNVDKFHISQYSVVTRL
ncbi:uncharacterized protein LOC101861007 [Aplysia californica]|uniref:RBR-type E3 ubiquitin transferase n=1 Tax=Aplysia californica TaxID=6500 RepID=A0ABM0K7Z0_APLCA|nr:uncharacterized protein LOC101861007 [Aplysia californica]